MNQHISTSTHQQINPHTRTDFSRGFQKFLQSLIRRRSFLLTAGKSKKNEMEMRNLVTKYTPSTWVKFTDLGAARFLVKHHAKLRRLIPSDAKATYRLLDDYLTKADNIINPEIF